MRKFEHPVLVLASLSLLLAFTAGCGKAPKENATAAGAPESGAAASTPPPAAAQPAAAAPANPAPPAVAPPPVAETKAPVAKAKPPVEKPKPQPIVVPAGTELTVMTTSPLSSKTSQAGQTFVVSLAQPVSVKGKTALPAKATLSGKVISAKAKGKVKGEGELSLQLTSISVRGATYPISTEVLQSTVKGKGKRTAATTAGGAGAGALIGGIAGGGRGAGIGAAIGAGAGLIGGAATGNKQIEIPAESALTFTLTEPLTLPPAQ